MIHDIIPLGSFYHRIPQHQAEDLFERLLIAENSTKTLVCNVEIGQDIVSLILWEGLSAAF